MSRFAEEIPENLFSRLIGGVDSNADPQKFKPLTKTTLDSEYNHGLRRDSGSKPMVASQELLSDLAIVDYHTDRKVIVRPRTKSAIKKILYNQKSWSQRVTNRQRRGLPILKNIRVGKKKKYFNNPQRNVYGVTPIEIDNIIKESLELILKDI